MRESHFNTRARRHSHKTGSLWRHAILIAVAGTTLAPFAAGAAETTPVAVLTHSADELPTLTGPLPGKYPGDPKAASLQSTYPFYSTPFDLAGRGYVEEEYYLAGRANGWSATGAKLAKDIPYITRIVVRRPLQQRKFNGTVLVEWQNVSVGADIDSLFLADALTRAGYAWVGVSNQLASVSALRKWSPTRYGKLDVSASDTYVADELSYDIYAQVGALARSRAPTAPLSKLNVERVFAVGSGESANRISNYYDHILPQTKPVFDAYGLMVGNAPTRAGAEPIFQVLAETDVRSSERPANTDRFRRWEVAGASSANWTAREYREPISIRDKGPGPGAHCDREPFSRVPWQHVAAAAIDHLVRWVKTGTPPPIAEPLQLNPDGTKVRNELGLALGGIRLSQVEAPIALNTGDNGGGPFCTALGTHIPFDAATLQRLYPSYADYIARVKEVDGRNVEAGYLLPEDAKNTARAAAASDIGR